ncbi:MAG: DNA polymerase III subunit delta [Gammaproteobacteria bacterium]|nr:DNA polymerase III subunit delta [Gammaproteobacteria bacterium]
MKISPAQLEAKLKRQLMPCYLVSGDEPLMVDETIHAIRTAAKSQGCHSRERFDLTPGFDQQLLQRALEHDSLFGDKKLIELHLANSSMTPTLKQLVENYQGHQETVFLISCAKLTASQMKSKWYRQLDAIGVVVQIWPLKRQELPGFIRQRLQRVGFQPSTEVIDAIAEQSEGNLLAIRQLGEKLALLFEPGTLTLPQVEQVLHDNPHFDIFALGESALRGESKRCCMILTRLQQQGVESILILWSLSREIRLLLTLLRGGDIPVWQKRQALYQNCLRRVNQRLLYRLLQQAARTDRMIKGVESGNVWDQLLTITLQLASAKGKR